MSNWSKYIALIFIWLYSIALFGHEIRPAYLEITQTSNSAYNILWKIPVIQGKAPNIDPIFPDEFHTDLLKEEWLKDALLTRYIGKYEGTLNGQTLSIANLETSLIDVLVQVNLQDGTAYTLLLQSGNATMQIPTEPDKWETAKLYCKLGVEHILLGIDHLLFVLGLLLLVEGLGKLVKTVTAFTIAHSITLALAALGFVSLPQAPVEAVIALSIVFLAKEYIRHREGKESLTARYPWLVAFAFGLLHGLGFAGALSEIGLPQKEVPMALFTFNVGVEVGQLLFITVIFMLYFLWKQLSLYLPKWSWKIMPYLMGSIASYWLIDRVLGFV